MSEKLRDVIARLLGRKRSRQAEKQEAEALAHSFFETLADKQSAKAVAPESGHLSFRVGTADLWQDVAVWISYLIPKHANYIRESGKSGTPFVISWRILFDNHGAHQFANNRRELWSFFVAERDKINAYLRRYQHGSISVDNEGLELLPGPPFGPADTNRDRARWIAFGLWLARHYMEGLRVSTLLSWDDLAQRYFHGKSDGVPAFFHDAMPQISAVVSRYSEGTVLVGSDGLHLMPGAPRDMARFATVPTGQRKQTLRAFIQNEIRAGQGDAQIAAINVCVMLEGKLGLYEQGWFVNDPVLLNILGKSIGEPVADDARLPPDAFPTFATDVNAAVEDAAFAVLEAWGLEASEANPDGLVAYPREPQGDGGTPVPPGWSHAETDVPDSGKPFVMSVGLRDFRVWLSQRLDGITAQTVVPWKMLWQQVGSAYIDLKDFKNAVVRITRADDRVEASGEGLVLCPRNPVDPPQG